MDFFYSLYHLYCNQKYCLKVEGAFTSLEKIFKRRAQHVHNHHMELLVGNRIIGPDIVKARNTSLASEFVNEL